jgi:hypothetical protein
VPPKKISEGGLRLSTVKFLCLEDKKYIENNLGLLKYARNTELTGTFTSTEYKPGEPT